MHIESKAELKKFASALRRELKLIYSDTSPSHTQVLELLAKSLGHKNASSLWAALPDTESSASGSLPASQASACVQSEQADETAAKWPLKNINGLYDLCKVGHGGAIVHGRTFAHMQGTVDDIFTCVNYVNAASRKKDGSVFMSRTDDTDVNWDGQETRTTPEGEALWAGEDHRIYGQWSLVLIPEGMQLRLKDDAYVSKLPVRKELIEAYVRASHELQLMPALKNHVEHLAQAPELEQVADLVGFALHPGEVRQLAQLVAAA